MSLLEGLLNWKSHAEILSTCLIRPEIRRLICIELPELSRIIDFNDWIAREQLYKKEHEIVFGRINWLRWKDVFLHCGTRFFWSFGSFGEKWTKQMKRHSVFSMFEAQHSKLNIQHCVPHCLPIDDRRPNISLGKQWRDARNWIKIIIKAAPCNRMMNSKLN